MFFSVILLFVFRVNLIDFLPKRLDSRAKPFGVGVQVGDTLLIARLLAVHVVESALELGLYRGLPSSRRNAPRPISSPGMFRIRR